MNSLRLPLEGQRRAWFWSVGELKGLPVERWSCCHHSHEVRESPHKATPWWTSNNQKTSLPRVSVGKTHPLLAWLDFPTFEPGTAFQRDPMSEYNLTPARLCHCYGFESWPECSQGPASYLGRVAILSPHNWSSLWPRVVILDILFSDRIASVQIIS